MKTAIAYIDGSGNSDRVQACAVFLRTRGEEFRRTRLLPPNTTNNVGEYNGVLLAVELALKLKVEVLDIRSDSLLIVNQLKGEWKCRNDALKNLRDLVQEEARGLKRVSIEWIPREENTIADALCRKAIKKAQADALFAIEEKREIKD